MWCPAWLISGVIIFNLQKYSSGYDNCYSMDGELKQKARRWCFTWNNYTDETVEGLKGLSAEKVDYLIVGFEIAPTTGTPHLQGYVEFKTPMAGSTVKSRLDPVKKTKSAVSVRHCAGSRDENIAYVRKSESKDPAKTCEDGSPLIIELKHSEKNQGRRTDWDVYFEFLLNNPDFDKFAEQYPEIAIKYHGGIEKVIRGAKNKQMLDEVRKTYSGVTPREWQQKLLDEVQKPANDRKIIWYHDEAGNSGKTWLSKLLFVEHGAAYFTNSKTADITYAYQGEPIVIFDFSRSNEDMINYGAIETVKNGIMFSGKFEARTKLFKSPHVIVMANFAPNRAMLSADRWDVRVPGMANEVPMEVPGMANEVPVESQESTNSEPICESPVGNTDACASEPQDEVFDEHAWLLEGI